MNPRAKKPPQHDQIPHETNHIAEHHLRAQPPPEEPEVAGMAQQRVHAVRDQHVAVLALHLHRVVEVAPRLGHGERARGLPDGHESQAENELDLDAEEDGPGPGEVALVGVEGVGEEAFRRGGGVGEVVGPAVGGEEEGGDRGVAGVVGCCDVVFEEVEEAERGEEEGDAPEGRGGGEAEREGERGGEAERGADEEGP